MREHIADWEASLLRSGLRSRSVDSYRRTALAFVRIFPELDAADITTKHIERFIGRFTGISPKTGEEYEPNTRVQRECALSSFFTFLRKEGVLQTDPFLGYERTRRKPAYKQTVVTISSEDVLRLFDACEWPGERACLALLAYLGPRRSALAHLRRKHVDLERGVVSFPEWKGRDSFTMEMPSELLTLLRGLYAHSARIQTMDERYRRKFRMLLDDDPEAYVVPNTVPSKVRRKRRDDRAIWNIVKRVAKRAGVNAHVHSLRAAFATFYMESNPHADLLSLKEVMGHASLSTTEVYLRRISRDRAMRTVRDLSWGFSPLGAYKEAHTGFEPVLPPAVSGTTNSEQTRNPRDIHGFNLSLKMTGDEVGVPERQREQA